MSDAAIELRDVFRVHSTPEGDAAALQGLSLRVGERRGADRARPERLGQVDAAPDPRRASTGRRRGSSASTARRSASCRRAGWRDYRSTLLGYADQHYTRALAPELTARELVALQLGLRGRPQRSERLRRADELLERVGLAGEARPAAGAAVGRRAAARRAVRGARARAARVPRRRADRRARRRDGRSGLRDARRARARARLHDA